jgi:hypothetical protein
MYAKTLQPAEAAQRLLLTENEALHAKIDEYHKAYQTAFQQNNDLRIKNAHLQQTSVFHESMLRKLQLDVKFAQAAAAAAAATGAAAVSAATTHTELDAAIHLDASAAAAPVQLHATPILDTSDAAPETSSLVMTNALDDATL